MNFIEAVGDWKSNDEWRYADKEAAWKFFFAAGKESSQAVISAQCVKMSQYESIIFELRQRLASAEEHNKRLREVLVAVNDLIEASEGVVGLHLNGDVAPWGELRTGGRFEEWLCLFDQAISTPASTEALDSYVAEKVNKIESCRDWYKRRIDLLQEWQSKMRDPERTIVCDIIANGLTMPEGGRYEIGKSDLSTIARQRDLAVEFVTTVATSPKLTGSWWQEQAAMTLSALKESERQ